MKSNLFDLPGSYDHFPRRQRASGLSEWNAVTHRASDRFVALSVFKVDLIKNYFISTGSRLGNEDIPRRGVQYRSHFMPSVLRFFFLFALVVPSYLQE